MEYKKISTSKITRRQIITLTALTLGGIVGFWKWRFRQPLSEIWYKRTDCPLSGLALVDNTLVSIGLPDILVVLNANTGEQIKHVSLPPTSDGSAWALLGSSDQSLILYDAVEIISINAVTGALKWKVMLKDCQPTILGDYLIVASTGQILCLTISTGEKQWKYPLPQCAIKALCSSKKRVAVALDTNPGKILLLNAETGTLIKSLSITTDSLVSSPSGIIAYNAESGDCNSISSSGELLWQWTTSNSGRKSSDQLCCDAMGEIYLLGGDISAKSKIMHLSQRAGQPLWTYFLDDRHIACPLRVGKFLVVGSGYGKLSLIRVTSGEEVASVDLATTADHASLINQYGVGPMTTLLGPTNEFYACSAVGAIALMRINA